MIFYYMKTEYSVPHRTGAWNRQNTYPPCVYDINSLYTAPERFIIYYDLFIATDFI